ncbi:MAG: ABC transporter permease [Acidobacteria bacterium]|nr:ABC transporter permease [Acidobacteriota bacterium]
MMTGKTFANLSRRWSLFWGLLLLFVLLVCAVFSDFMTPYDPTTQNRELYLAPPSSLHFTDTEGFRHWVPFVYALQLVDRERMLYVEERSVIYPIRFLVPGEPYRLFGLFPCRTHLFGVDGPARIFILGSDGLGRDVFSRIVHGARLSLAVAGVALLIAIPLALVVGSVSGYYGGPFDFTCMRVIELFLALPALYLIIALRSALPLSLAPEQVLFAMVIVIALFGWASMARIVRGAVLSLREREFILAAIALGASDPRVIFRHIWPNLTAIILTQAALSVPGFILAEVTLSYLGLGVPEPLPSWGSMLASVGSVQQLGSFWWNLAPGAAIFITSLAFYLLAEGLSDLADPHSQIL